METDVLVIGSGVAGLTYAVNLAIQNKDLKITILTKTNEDETNTKYAQGGIAAVIDLNKDSFEKHIDDTLIAGDGLCNKSIVDIVVHEGPERLKEIISWGADFDKEENGVYKLGKEGGHSENRILHYKDITGWEIERALLEKAHQYPNIHFIDYCYVIDLITQHHLGELVTKSSSHITCFGVYILNIKTQQIEKIISKVTMLATGGCGQVYRTTTNPKIATGDGVAMVYRAKGRIENMEFIQFHPTALYEAGKRFGQSFLITEAVRGDGAILRNSKGEDFMKKYDSRLSLAPRDIVARAIDNEMKILGDEHVYLDCRHMDMTKFKEHFPNIYEKCLSIGIDVAKDMIPVAPAAHYSCGGVKTAITATDAGILNPWLGYIRDVYRLHKKELNSIKTLDKRTDRLVELNVLEQCINLVKTRDVQQALLEKRIEIHGWVFDMRTGRLIDLSFNTQKVAKEVLDIYNIVK